MRCRWPLLPRSPTAAFPGSATAAGSVTATFTKTSDWGTGYEAKYTITNGTSAATSSWNLQFDLPTGQHVASIWSDPYTTSGQHVTITNASWDGVIAAGASLDVGFDIGYSRHVREPDQLHRQRRRLRRWRWRRHHRADRRRPA